MGWHESHLHCFLIDGEEYMGLDPMGGKMDSDGRDAARYRLSDVVREEKAKFSYQYDFGDDWRHAISLEKIIPAPAAPVSSHSFECLAGAGACPPEDCGGIWGYYRLLEILGDPKNEEHEEMKEWAGDIDPAKRLILPLPTSACIGLPPVDPRPPPPPTLWNPPPIKRSGKTADRMLRSLGVKGNF